MYFVISMIFCNAFIPQWEQQCLTDGTRKRKRAGRMTMSEIMKIIIAFHMSNHRDFKNFYTGYLARFYKSDFPNLLSYTRFLDVMPSTVIPMYSYFSSLKSEPPPPVSGLLTQRALRFVIIYEFQGIKR